MWRILSRTKPNLTSGTIINMSATSDRLVEFFKAVDEANTAQVDEMLETKLVSVEDKNVNALNATALDRAAYWGHDELVHLLVDKYKADLKAKNDHGKIPLETAVDNYNARIVRFLIKRNSDKVEYANKVLNSKSVEELVEAAEENNISKVSELIESNKVDVNSVDKGSHNGTILHIAARNGYEELARILVDKYKANINHTDDIGDRPVDVAVMNENEGVVDFLVNREHATKQE